MAANVSLMLYSRYSIEECRRRITAATGPDSRPAETGPGSDLTSRPVAVRDGDGYRISKAKSAGSKTALVWLHVTIEVVGRGGSLLRVTTHRRRALWVFRDPTLLAAALLSAAMAVVTPLALLPTALLVAMIVAIMPVRHRLAEQDRERLIRQLTLLVDAQPASVLRDSAAPLQGAPMLEAPTPAAPAAQLPPAPRSALTGAVAERPFDQFDEPDRFDQLDRFDRFDRFDNDDNPTNPNLPAVVPRQAEPLPADRMVPARAIVREVYDLIPAGLEVGPTGGLADVVFEVTREDGVRYTTLSRISFYTLDRRTRVGTVGSEVLVRVDPNDQGSITVDLRPVESS